MYKLYTDKSENFVADVSVKNASLKNSVARLVVETADLNLVFKGTIEDQKCNIPIKKMKGILPENTQGKMYLEIIVEDVYFRPWESDFMVDEHTSMKVVVKEQVVESDKPILEVKVAEKPLVSENEIISEVNKVVVENEKKTEVIKEKLTPAQEIVLICERVGVKKNNFSKEEIVEVLKEYFQENQHLIENKVNIIKDVYQMLRSSDVK